MVKYEKKIYIITGSSSGIGLFLAKKLSIKNIVIGCSRGKVHFKNKNYFHYKLDLTNETQIINFINKIENKFKKIDVLINNAATNISHGSFLMTSNESIKTTLNTNVLSIFILTKGIARIMVKNKSGKIINISSLVTKILPPGESIYASSKASVETFTKIISKELKKLNITCNCISPYLVKTKMIEKIDKIKVKFLLNKGKEKKFNSLQDILFFVNYIVNDKTLKVTGNNFRLSF